MDIEEGITLDGDDQFDEAWYLRQNGDIAEAVRGGGFRSGREHYLLHGRVEGRPPRPSVAGTPLAESALARSFADHNGSGFLTPAVLSVSEVRLNRIALVGSCLVRSWGFEDYPPVGCPADLYIVNNAAQLPEVPAEVIASYDFLVIQVPLRPVLVDDALWHFPYTDELACEAAFQRSCNVLEYQLNTWMQWNDTHGLLTFVANFFVPQQNPMGRLVPRYSLRNPEYFISRLNEHLETVVRRRKNAYVLDIDRLSASVGRRYTQDDPFALLSHNGTIGFGPTPEHRIEPIAPLENYHDTQWGRRLRELIWAELMAMYRTVRQIDPVKVVVIDLDDTLWNGISGDMQDISGNMVEGWPIGLAEALIYLKKRGILLAIASKNEEARIREIWPLIFHGRLSLDDFAAVRIDWRPKAENMREILEGMNLLPRNALFIDDNPAERDAMRRAFPEMRILGRHPPYLRRILLWSPETQVASVTDESSRRTEMVQAQFSRESQRKELSREQFLADAAPRIEMLTIESAGHTRFARVLELLNKTNQFNTIGRRWRTEECEAFFRSGGQMAAFEVTDRFTNYGLVGVVMFRAAHIKQWAMSCRVLGYQIEEAVMAALVGVMRATGPVAVTGHLIYTDVNFPCRDLFHKCGFTDPGDNGRWTLAPETRVNAPSHVSFV